MRRSLRLALAALLGLAVLAGASVDFRWGDLRFGVANKTMRHWSVVDVVVHLKPACAGGFIRSGGGPCGGSGAGTTYTFTGPSSSVPINVATSNFTVQGTSVPAVTVTPADSSHHGVFSPASVAMSGSAASQFNYTPLQTGTYNLTVANSGALTNPAAISFTSANLAPGYPGMTAGTWVTNHDATFATGIAGDPFGGANASRITEGVATDYHSIISNTVTTVSGQSYTISMMLKVGSGSRLVDIELDEVIAFSAAYGMVINPATCAIVGTYFWGGATIASTATRTANLGTGWCLAQITGTLGAFTSTVIQVFPDNGTTNLYAGDGTSNTLLYGPAIQ